MSIWICRLVVSVLLGVAGLPLAHAQATGEPPAAPEQQLFAIEFRVGPSWDASKPPHEQAFFKEHSANLRRMRDAGLLIMGARYSDKGLIVVAAKSAAEARAQMDLDPSIAAGTFIFELHPFSVFFGGELKPRARR